MKKKDPETGGKLAGLEGWKLVEGRLEHFPMSRLKNGHNVAFTALVTKRAAAPPPTLTVLDPRPPSVPTDQQSVGLTDDKSLWARHAVPLLQSLPALITAQPDRGNTLTHSHTPRVLSNYGGRRVCAPR